MSFSKEKRKIILSIFISDIIWLTCNCIEQTHFALVKRNSNPEYLNFLNFCPDTWVLCSLVLQMNCSTKQDAFHIDRLEHSFLRALSNNKKKKLEKKVLLCYLWNYSILQNENSPELAHFILEWGSI